MSSELENEYDLVRPQLSALYCVDICNELYNQGWINSPIYKIKEPYLVHILDQAKAAGFKPTNEEIAEFVRELIVEKDQPDMFFLFLRIKDEGLYNVIDSVDEFEKE